jgi:hypothetical protein
MMIAEGLPGIPSTMAWVKGQSGNPDGRAAEKPMRDAIELELAQEQDAKDFRDATKMLHIARPSPAPTARCTNKSTGWDC